VKPPGNWIERFTGYRREGDETHWHTHVVHVNDKGGPWWLSAQWMFHPTVRGYYLGPTAKGWWTLGPKRTSGHGQVGLALGGEDSMFQVELQVPKLFSWHAGVRVPRKWVSPVVYERRTLSIRPGYIGHLAWVDVLYDETARDMRSYYAEKRGPYGGECAHCKLPGYCHAPNYTPPVESAEVHAYEFRYFDETYQHPTHSEVAACSKDRALGELEGLHNKGYRVRLYAVDWPEDAKCWTAIGTDMPRVVACPGWEKAESYEPSRAALWPGWQVKIDVRMRDLLLGRKAHESRNITHEVEPAEAVRYLKTASGEMALGVPAVVAMPEGNYPCVTRFYEETWQRPRLPWASRVSRRAEVLMLVPIPIPGKGENSYDIDDDAIYSLSAPGTSVAAATSQAASSALRDRERRSSRDWRPGRGWATGVYRSGGSW
jgi:hypothetical protein